MFFLVNPIKLVNQSYQQFRRSEFLGLNLQPIRSPLYWRLRAALHRRQAVDGGRAGFPTAERRRHLPRDYLVQLPEVEREPALYELTAPRCSCKSALVCITPVKYIHTMLMNLGT